MIETEAIEIISEIWDETDDYIRHRERDPDDFQKDTFRTIVIKRTKPRIKAIIGRLIGKTTTTIQAYLFPKADGWTMDKAKDWVKSHKREKEMYDGEIELVSESFFVEEEIVEEAQKTYGGKYKILEGYDLRVPDDFMETIKDLGDENPFFIVVPIMAGYSQFDEKNIPHRKWSKEVIYSIGEQINQNRLPAYMGHANLFNLTDLPDIPAIWIKSARAKNIETNEYGILVKGYVYSHNNYRALIKTGAIHNVSVFGFGNVNIVKDESYGEIEEVDKDFKLISIDFIRKRTQGMPETQIIQIASETNNEMFNYDELKEKIKDLDVEEILEIREDIVNKNEIEKLNKDISELNDKVIILEKELAKAIKSLIDEFCKSIKIEGVRKIALEKFKGIATYEDFVNKKDKILNEAKAEYIQLAKDCGFDVDLESFPKQSEESSIFRIASPEIRQILKNMEVK